MAESISVERIRRTLEAGWRYLEPYRRARHFAMREYVGAWYGSMPDLAGRPDTDKRPINLLHQFIQLYTFALVNDRVKFTVRPRRYNMRGEALMRELMINHRAEQIGLIDTHRLVVMDALFGGMGIYVVGTGESGDEIRFRGNLYDPGQFFVSRVDLDDFSADFHCVRDVRETRVRAHRLIVRRDLLLEMYPESERIIRELPSLRSGPSFEESETSGIGNMWSYESYERVFDEVEVWEATIYLDHARAVRGIMPGFLSGPAAWIAEPTEYLGKQGGPYVLLGFEDVPNNPMYLAPVASIMDLHIALALCGVKAVRQILSARRNIFYRPGSEDTMIRVMESQEDEPIRASDPTAIRAEELGGLSPATMAGFEWLKREANNATTNLQQARGVSGDAGTATEAAILSQNMNRIIASMRGRARKALTEIGQHMGYDLDSDIMVYETFMYRSSGGVELPLVYDGSRLNGSWTDFTWEITPYDSDAVVDRNVELARFVQLLQMLVPSVQGVAALGGDVPALMRIMAQKWNVPELDELFPTEQILAAHEAALGMATEGMGKQGGIPVTTAPRPRTETGRNIIDQYRSDAFPAVHRMPEHYVSQAPVMP